MSDQAIRNVNDSLAGLGFGLGGARHRIDVEIQRIADELAKAGYTLEDDHAGEAGQELEAIRGSKTTRYEQAERGPDRQ